MGVVHIAVYLNGVHHFPANSSPPVTLDGNKQIIKKKKKTKKTKTKTKKQEEEEEEEEKKGYLFPMS
jgi:hypothetical protein